MKSMVNKKIFLIAFLFLIPSQVHAETKEHRDCILKAATERKDLLKQNKELKNSFLIGLDKTAQDSIARESSQFELKLSDLKKLRAENIKKAAGSTERHLDLEKIKKEYLQNVEALKENKENHIQTIQTEYKSTLNEAIARYKKVRINIWDAFVKAKDTCSKS